MRKFHTTIRETNFNGVFGPGREAAIQARRRLLLKDYAGRFGVPWGLIKDATTADLKALALAIKHRKAG